MAQNLNYFRLVGNFQMQIARNLDYLPFGEILSSDSNIATHKIQFMPSAKNELRFAQLRPTRCSKSRNRGSERIESNTGSTARYDIQTARSRQATSSNLYVCSLSFRAA